MKMLDRIGRGLLLAVATPLLVVEEARAILDAPREVLRLRYDLAKRTGERDEARRIANAAECAAFRHSSHVQQLRAELAGREQMVSEAKAETREAQHALKATVSDARTWQAAHGEALAASRELQGEVDKARAERDAAKNELARMGARLHESTTKIGTLQRRIEQSDKDRDAALGASVELRATIRTMGLAANEGEGTRVGRPPSGFETP